MTPASGPVSASGSPAIERLVLDVRAQPDEVGALRHSVVSFLRGLGVSDERVGDIELAASELVTNAVIHPPRVISDADLVHLELAVADEIVLHVSHVGPADAIPPLEQWRPAPPRAVVGHGLGIVRQICDDVSIAQVGDRAVVSCRLPRA